MPLPPWKAFCFAVSFPLSFLKCYANWCLHVSKMATSLLIASPTTLCAGRNAPHFQITWYLLSPWGSPAHIQRQWNANYSPSWHSMKTCCNSFKERGIWEFDFFNNSHKFRESLASVCVGGWGGAGHIPVTSPTQLLKSLLLIMISTNINNSNTKNGQVFSLSELRDKGTILQSTTANQ